MIIKEILFIDNIFWNLNYVFISKNRFLNYFSIRFNNNRKQEFKTYE